jgi:hypothetical protein
MAMERRAGQDILASARRPLDDEPALDSALFTLAGDFSPGRPVRKSRLVEFLDEPGP